MRVTACLRSRSRSPFSPPLIGAAGISGKQRCPEIPFSGISGISGKGAGVTNALSGARKPPDDYEAARMDIAATVTALLANIRGTPGACRHLKRIRERAVWLHRFAADAWDRDPDDLGDMDDD